MRWWDRTGERYLATHSEEVRGREAAELTQLAERQARMSDRQALLTAEERIRQLEEELARLQDQESQQ